MTLQIFLLCISPNDPARDVKSWAKANTGRPFTFPKPVTTPSAGISTCSMPKLTHRCVTKISVSRKVPGSKNRSSRSRAVSLPLARCFSTALAPPIPLICPSFSFNSRIFSATVFIGGSSSTKSMLQVCCIGADRCVRPGRTLRGAPTKDENYLFECNPAKTTGIDIKKAYREAAQMEIGQSMICLSEIFLQGGWRPGLRDPRAGSGGQNATARHCSAG